MGREKVVYLKMHEGRKWGAYPWERVRSRGMGAGRPIGPPAGVEGSDDSPKDMVLAWVVPVRSRGEREGWEEEEWSRQQWAVEEELSSKSLSKGWASGLRSVGLSVDLA